MKKSEKQDWHNLANILAILSGTLLIGAGLFANMLATSYSAIQTNVGLIYQSQEVEPNAKPYLLEANKVLSNYTNIIYTLFKCFLGGGIVLFFGSLGSWFWAYKSK